MPTDVNRVPLALQLAAIVSASALVLRTLDERALSATLYAANIWNVIFWAGAGVVLVSFGRWPGAATFRKPLWLALAGCFILCLCLVAYFLWLLMFEHHRRDSLTWYEDNQVLLPILNLGVPVGAVALCGLAILCWRGEERVWKVLALVSVLAGITCGALVRGSVVESRFPGYSLAGQVWWLKGPAYEARHNDRTALDAGTAFVYMAGVIGPARVSAGRSATSTHS